MLWEVYQQTKIAQAGQAAERAEGTARRQSDEIVQLRKQVENLTLVSQAMWELLRDNTGFTEDDLDKKVLEVDLRDGKADGKINPTVMQCPSCKNNNNSKRDRCVICGTELKKAHKFEG